MSDNAGFESTVGGILSGVIGKLAIGAAGAWVGVYAGAYLGARCGYWDNNEDTLTHIIERSI